MNIIDNILIWIFDRANDIVTSLPTTPELPTDLTTALSTFLASLKSWDNFFPATEFLTVLAFILVVEGVLLVVRFTNWVINKLRGSGN